TAALLELAADRDKITPTTYRPEWSSPEIRTPGQAADAGQKLHAMGVPLASILSETMGWTPEQATTALARRRDHRVDRAAAGLLRRPAATARDRILAASAPMTSPPAADPATVARVLSDMLVQTTGAAGLDGAALARRQMEELGIEVAPDYFRPLTEQTAKNDAIRRAVEDRARFDRAVSTILEGGDEAAAMRIGRLALSEAVASARAVCAEYMRGTRQVSGWVRQLDSDPCELCTYWSWDGRVWPAGHSMPTHKGCACAQR